MTMTMTEQDLRNTEIRVRIRSGAGPHFDRKGKEHEQNGAAFAVNGLELKAFSDKFEVEPADRSLADKILHTGTETGVEAAIAAAPAAEAQQEEADEASVSRSTTGRQRRK